MTEITERLPFPLTRRQETAALYAQSTFLPDITIDSLPFFLAISDEQPYVRQTLDSKRQQIDISTEPGEQSLSQWWVRDQTSWHRGAGINFYEPASDTKTQFRYDVSYGIDVWDEGEIKLHKKMTSIASNGGSTYATSAVVSGVDNVFLNVAGTVSRHNGTSGTTYSNTGGTPATEPVVAGSKVLVGATAGIMSGDVTGSALTVLWSTATTVLRPWWAKSRIIAAQGAALYDLTLAGGTLGSQTPLFTHPSSTWTWSAVAEAPGAILAAGYDSGYGYIYRFALEEPSSGSTPTLGAATQVAEFPPGEQVHSLKVYLAAFVAIGTSKGVRIGVVDANGTISYGPLTIETTKPVRSLSARDSFVYAGIEDDLNGNSGCARIDLSESVSDLRYAWAYDADSTTIGQVDSVTFLGVSDRVVLGVQGSGAWLQSATAYVDSGYLVTGKIRYSTAEPKLFNRAKVRATFPGTSTCTLSTIDFNGSEQSLIALGSAFNTDEDITLRSLASAPQPYAQLKLTLTSSTAGAATPVVTSLQIKATPLPEVQREIRIPLRLNDIEEDRNHVKVGYTGAAWDRLVGLEEIEEERSVVTVQDYTNGEAFSAQIRQVQLVRTTPPARNKTNFGGQLNVTLVRL